MVSLQLGQIRRGTVVRAKSGGGAWRAPAPVRQLYWRVRSRLRNAVLPPRPAMRRGRAATPRFGYDLQSYARNFDDGLASGHRF